ncbi:MAG: nucleoside-diphosphate sugar epimerase/dehydratase [Lachnospiraceae bacterium]|nr:nucleoside-diphosphate sugar epimerase/dehydratase [Lachnospiraceae bacterium]
MKKVNTHLFEHSRESRIRSFLLGVVDCVMIACIIVTSLLVRFDLRFRSVEPMFWKSVITYLPIGVISTLIIFIIFKLYSSMWRFASVEEAMHIVLACLAACIVQVLTIFYIMHLPIPRSYPLFFGMQLLIGTAAIRFGYRGFRVLRAYFIHGSDETIRTMIIGAGKGGEVLINEMRNSKYIDHEAVCIIDDDPAKLGTYIHGVRVVGDRTKISQAVNDYNVKEIVFAIPSMKPSERKEILDYCKETCCNVKLIPGIYQMVNEEVSISRLKNVEIEDLLGRDPIRNDNSKVMGYVEDQVVMVTGGGGSIGSELCRQIADYHPKQLIVLDNYENNAYDLQMELIHNHPELDLIVLIVSVQNKRRINNIIKNYRPKVIFHAAAHKHVPLMENSPCDAIRNNVFGTYNVARAASENDVKRMVLISTDKAVRPTNIMGASKRICELVIQYFNGISETEYMAVRFGNVLGSNGSVVPLFRKQIQAGGPVTVTHPDIIRYFMTIPEAVNLVLEAGAYGHGGEIFILDMGEPVKILDLAENMIRLSGYVPNEDIKIIFTGLRPGEKLYEELLISEKNKIATNNNRIFIAQLPPKDPDVLKKLLAELHDIAYSEDVINIRKAVKKLVPEYHYVEAE